MSNTPNATGSFSEDEKAAMRERAKELAKEAKMEKNKEAGEKAVLEAIEKLPEPDKSMALQIHKIVKANAPDLWSKTWYGMPAYATKEGKVVCFFQAASKFKYRYSTLGFQEDAHLDDGNMWPASFALIKITDAEKSKIIELVKKAIA